MNDKKMTSSVSKVVHMIEEDNLKKCTQCFEIKSRKEFYVSIYMRSECKKCTISHVTKKQKPSRERYADQESKDVRNQYQRDYYSKNKEKMAGYREAFKERKPGYYKEYHRTRNNQASTPETQKKELA